jgi:hypothetical protein
MTDDRMAMIELIEKGADSDLVRELLAFAAARLSLSAAPAANVWRLAVPHPGSCSRLSGLTRAPAAPSSSKVKDYEGSATMPGIS